MLQLTTEHLEQYIDVLEEADKAFVGDVKRDFVAQAQADIFFQLGIRDKDLMRWGLNRVGIIKGQYHTSCLDIIGKFQTGKYSFDKAFNLWRDATKTSMEGMYRAGAASVGNPFYKELKLPGRDKRLLTRYLHREGKFWKKFMWDVKDPKHTAFIPRDAAGKRLPGYRFKMFDYPKRAGMYPQSLEAMRYNGMLMGAGENIELRWVLGVPQTESCGDCMGLSKRVWTPRTLPTVPRGGDTACLWRCYCHLEPRQRVMRTTFDIAGSATEGAIRAAGRYSQVFDTAGNEIGGALQREIEAYSAQMNRARQMMSITAGADKTFWIAERKRFNRLIIDRCRAGQYRAIPTVSVSALTKTIRAAQLKGGTLVDDFMTLVVGDEVWFVRSDYSSFGVIGTRNGVRVFKSPTGVVLNLDVEADIIFATQPKWRPSGTLEQVEKWAKGSAFEGSLFHGTRLTPAKSITKMGFDIKRSHYGMLGKGIYLSSNETTAGRYAAYKAREPGKVLEIKINVKKPLTDLKIMTELEKKWMKKLDIDMPGHFKVWDKVTEELIKMGYDAVRIDLFGGVTEWCIFDPKNIMVVAK